MVLSCSGQVVRPQIRRNFVGAVPELKGVSGGLDLVDHLEGLLAHDNIG